MKKNHMKLALDCLMVILLVLMYQYRVINASFHEIGGLVFIGLMVIHLIFNYKWICNITKKIFNKGTTKKNRIGYVLNILLLICFLLIGISGILISKTLFSFQGSMIFKTIHYFCSALALILIGIHVGLHSRYLIAIIGRPISLPAKAKQGIALVLAIGVLGFGGYSIATTSFVQWISMPFTGATIGNHGGKDMGQRPEGMGQNNDNKDFSNKQMHPSDQNDSNANFQNGERPDGFPTDRGNGQGFQKGGKEAMDSSPIMVILNYVTIIGFFAIITHLVEGFFLIKRSNKPLEIPMNDENNE
ncbi:hypothetical protein lbkm_1043 [Lachnospiraceae bacterium KM106-2]|nr:hypothetical protein lbkm_1043 [Lachnospiraceae bacterium KM106-2]